jgi:uncharacterized membrane protein
MQDHRDQGRISSLIIIATMAMVVLAMCSGCSTVVPVTQRFPEAPGTVAMTACPQLKKIAEDARLSDISKTITMNYSTYYECAVKTDAWIEWYQKQQQIFNNVK